MTLEEQTAQGSMQWGKKSSKSGGGGERVLWGVKGLETAEPPLPSSPTNHLKPQLPISTDASTVTPDTDAQWSSTPSSSLHLYPTLPSHRFCEFCPGFFNRLLPVCAHVYLVSSGPPPSSLSSSAGPSHGSGHGVNQAPQTPAWCALLLIQNPFLAPYCLWNRALSMTQGGMRPCLPPQPQPCCGQACAHCCCAPTWETHPLPLPGWESWPTFTVPSKAQLSHRQGPSAQLPLLLSQKQTLDGDGLVTEHTSSLSIDSRSTHSSLRDLPCAVGPAEVVAEL